MLLGEESCVRSVGFRSWFDFPNSAVSGDPSRVRRRSVSWIVLLAVILIPPTAGGVALATYLFMDDLPSTLPEERRQADSFRSIVYAADGKTEIGEFRAGETRVVIDAEQIPKTIKDAVIAAEDQDFYEHDGVDWRATTRALWADLRSREINQGGSTITQQLVKNLYVGNERSVTRKVREALVAADVERTMDKDEILAKYLNTVYMGDSVFGVEAAVQSYFRKTAQDITLSEAALLVGVLPAPSRYSPRSNPEGSELKRTWSSTPWSRAGCGHPEEVAAARAEIPEIHPPPPSRAATRSSSTTCGCISSRGGHGARPVVPGRAEDRHRPSSPASRTRCSRSSTRRCPARRTRRRPWWRSSRRPASSGPWSAGGTGTSRRSTWRSASSAAGRAARPGSSFKPFVQARALDAGVAAQQGVLGADAASSPKGFIKPVCNYGGGCYGSATLRQGDGQVDQHRLRAADRRRRHQADGRDGQAPRDHQHQPGEGSTAVIAIGTQEVSPLDMASAFSRLRRPGHQGDPTPVLKITDYDGNVIEDNTLANRGAAGPRRGRGRQHEPDPPRGHRGGHRHRGQTRPAGGGQDGHVPELRERLVRRLHAHAVDRGVDGLPQRQHPDAGCPGRRPGHRRFASRPGCGRRS